MARKLFEECPVLPIVKKILVGLGGLLGVAALGGSAFAGFHVHAFNASLDKVYDVPLPSVALSTAPDVLARGQHLAGTLAPCTASDCHGTDLGGGKVIEIGPLGRFTAPNISAAGLGALYSDAELARLIRHGLKKDGRGVRFMPSHEFNWLPEGDVTAIVSYLRTVPGVQKPNGIVEVGMLGKVLDRLDMLPLDIARRIDHAHVELGPSPSPTPAYGAFIARACTGCHGKTLAGGPIPGAPANMAVPLNLTPDATGLRGWSYDEFKNTLVTGVDKNGKKLDRMMPIAAFGKLDDIEMHALYAYLMSLPPRPFGQR